MKIQEFIAGYRNYPVLFIGTGFSLRYLENSYTWDGLLRKITSDVTGNSESYLDIKATYHINGTYDYSKIGSHVERLFNESAMADRNGKFSFVNDRFYQGMELGERISRFKIYVAHVLSISNYKNKYMDEIPEIKKSAKNIGSIITTNYDKLVKDIFEFDSLIGNDILLSEPYGSIYKIHGTIDHPISIVINEKDYDEFETRYDLIRAQLLSLFIHNPIIFLGYSINDRNIKNLLKTIFKYVPPNTELAEKIRNNFLLVEYREGSESIDVVEHDIDMEGFSTIRINRISTDNYTEIYKCLASLDLPVSAMDIKKVQGVFKEIRSGGNIKVKITEDLESIKNSERIIAIGSDKSIRYEYRNKKDIILMYFDIIDKEMRDVVKIIDKYTIGTNEWFPIHGFASIYPSLDSEERLINIQDEKVVAFIQSELPQQCIHEHSSVEDVLDDDNISTSYKMNAICWGVGQNVISLDNAKEYLISYLSENKEIDSHHRKLLCIYDYKLYKTDN